jgi:cytochrome c oxidase subunit II
MVMMRRLGAWLMGLVVWGGTALAAQPEPWQMDLQPSNTELMDFITWFERFTLGIMAAIVAFVTLLLFWVIVRYRARKNPTASRTTHNTPVEIIWTVLPVMILAVIAYPSFQLLRKDMTIPEADLTIKATGYQWYWGYEYPDQGGVSFDSVMLKDDERKALIGKVGGTEKDAPRLLAVDYQMVVPVGKVVRLQITAADVLHAFAMPAFGLKRDAVPGRLNETWFKAEREGIYYGQCSELCGRDHAFMPIAIRVVSDTQFKAWAEAAATDIDQARDLLQAMVTQDNNQKLAARPQPEPVR